MDFDSFMGQAWSDHAEHPAAVADRLEAEGLAQLAQAADAGAITRLAHLAQHLHGGHLAQWQRGQRFQERLLALPAAAGERAAPLRRYLAGLALAAGEPGACAALAPDDRVTVAGLAAANLVDHDALRAGALLKQSEDGVAALALPDKHPAVRALAIAGNTIAATLEEKPVRTAEERALMLQAAAAGLSGWSRAGTWLETERAEYRLSRSWCLAGDAAMARQHAQACLRIVADHGNVPLEVFFGQEALALAEHAAGDSAARAAAVAAATAAFAQIGESDRGWCQATLDKLTSL